MLKIAVLGAGGFIGEPLGERILAQGYKLLPFTRESAKKGFHQGINVDLFDQVSIQAALDATKPNVVISTAWDTEHGKFWTNEINRQYKEATLKFAQLAFESGVDKFVALGSMSEYGNNPGLCNSAFTQTVRSDLYSQTKIETGIELEEIGQKFGKKTNWLRIFQAFGPNEKSERFIPGLIGTLRNEETFQIKTPKYEMDWIHTSDIASAILFTIENDLEHFVDIGTGRGTTVRDLSLLVCEQLGLDEHLLDFSSQIEGHQKVAVVDAESQLLAKGWKPDESLESRLKSLR